MSQPQIITGGARLAGIVGNPVSHSLSPIIHNGWLRAGGIDGAYVAFAPQDAAGFDVLVAAGRAGLIGGVNVTSPFKEQAFALCDTVSPAARLTGSTNILVFEAGQVHGDSSDGLGVLYALTQQAPALKLAGARVVMLGAGGAARAGAGALIEAGASIAILNRSFDRAEALARDLGPSVRVADHSALSSADLVINALSVPPQIDLAQLSDTTVVMDMTYKPVVTPFLQAARDRGLVTVDGLAMLIGQAAPSFSALYRQAPPELDLRALLMTHLGESA